jgi:hypothetical protein
VTLPKDPAKAIAYCKAISDRLKGKKFFHGKKHSEETKQKMRIAKLGPENPNWKGDHPVYKEAGRQRARQLYGVVPGMDIHHKDGNTCNNSPQNIMFIPRRYHMEIDGRLEVFKRTSYTKENNPHVK